MTLGNPDKPIPEISQELKDLQTRHLGAALVNLITGETPKAVIKTRPGRGGTYPYVPVYWFVPQLNALFGFLWDVVVDDKGVVEEEVDLEEDLKPEGLTDAEFGTLKIRKVLKKGDETFRIEDCKRRWKERTRTQVWVLGHLNLKLPGRTTIERELDGNGKVIKEIETRIEPVTITKHAFGGTDIKYFTGGDNAGMMMDLADDYKSAEADMLKKAASYLGMCADIYGKRELLQETGPNEAQLKALYRRAETKGLNRTKTTELCEKLFDGVKPEDLDSGQFLALMRHLMTVKPSTSIVPTGVK